jgi:putative flavoprotein involved in K+ transport
MKLVGRTQCFNQSTVIFNNDLADNIRAGDANYLSLLDRADAYITNNGLDLPEEPTARELLSDPDCMTNPTLELDMKAAGIQSIIWATGYSTDYSWLNVDAFDDNNQPKHHRGVSKQTGVYFLGLPWLSRRGSSFIWGVWHDAKYIADQIVIQRQYKQYNSKSAK